MDTGCDIPLPCAAGAPELSLSQRVHRPHVSGARVSDLASVWFFGLEVLGFGGVVGRMIHVLNRCGSRMALAQDA